MRDNRRKKGLGVTTPGRKILPKEEAWKVSGVDRGSVQSGLLLGREGGEERPLRGLTRCKDAGESFLHILKLWGALPSAA